MSEEIVFRHSGDIGDLLFSTHFIKDIIEWRKPSKVTLALTFDKPTVRGEPHPNGAVLMNKKTVDFVMSFFKHCGLYDEVNAVDFKTFEKIIPQIPILVDLDVFRTMKLNFFATDIREYYYALTTHHFNKDFSRNLFEGKFEGDLRAKGRVIVSYTSRVHSYYVHPHAVLFDRLDDISFIGLDSEYEEFCKIMDKKIHRFEIKTLEDAAYLIKGASGFFGNQGGLFSLAEMLKVPRLLLSPQYMVLNGRLSIGPANVNPMGGAWCDKIMVIDNSLGITKNFFDFCKGR